MSFNLIRKLRLDCQARQGLEQTFGAEYSRRLADDPSVEILVRPWVAFLVSKYTGTQPSDASTIWAFYQDVRVGLEPDQQKLADSVMGVLFASGQISTDVLASPLLMAEGGVEPGFDALDFVLYELTGDMEYASGAGSITERYLNITQLTVQLINDPKHALEPFKAQQRYINELNTDGQHVLAGKLNAELYAQVASIVYGAGTIGVISRRGLGSSNERPHATEISWRDNENGPRSLEEAIVFADERGTFFEGYIDIEVISDTQVIVEAEKGLRIKFVSVPDEEFVEVYGNRYAHFYSPMRLDETIFDPTTPQTWEKVFGEVVVVRIRGSVFESDRRLSAVIGHEFYEIRGLHSKLTAEGISDNDIPLLIDKLHNGAVVFGDGIVYEMIKEGI